MGNVQISGRNGGYSVSLNGGNITYSGVVTASNVSSQLEHWAEDAFKVIICLRIIILILIILLFIILLAALLCMILKAYAFEACLICLVLFLLNAQE